MTQPKVVKEGQEEIKPAGCSNLGVQLVHELLALIRGKAAGVEAALLGSRERVLTT